MSVVVQDNRDPDVVVYTKGAPDAVLRLCQQISGEDVKGLVRKKLNYNYNTRCVRSFCTEP